MLLKRGGWPYSYPPQSSIPFTINYDSPQSRGLVFWVPTQSDGRYPPDRIHNIHPESIDTAQLPPDLRYDSKLGQVLKVDNISRVGYKYAAHPSWTAPYPGHLTWGCWVRPEGVGGFAHICGHDGWGTGGDNRSYRIRWDDSGSGNMRFRAYISTDGTNTPYATSEILTPGDLYHVVGVYDSTSTINLYINGVWVGDGYNASYTGQLHDPGVDFGIGSAATNPGSAASLIGTITDVRVYNRELSAAEIWAWYNNPFELYRPEPVERKKIWTFPTKQGGWPYSQPPNVPFEMNRDSGQSVGLKAWWPFAGQQSLLAQDFSGNGKNATGLTDDPPEWEYDPQLGRGVHCWEGSSFPSSGRFINIGDDPDLEGFERVTFNIWCKLIDDDTGINWPAVLSKQSVYSINYQQSSGNLHTHLYTASANKGTFWGTAIQGQPQMITVSYDGAVTRFYQNGVYVTSDSTLSGALATNAYDIYIGDRGGSTAPGAHHVIYDVRIYDRVMTAEEVWSLYDPATRWELYKPLWEKPSGIIVPPTVEEAVGSPMYAYMQQ